MKCFFILNQNKKENKRDNNIYIAKYNFLSLYVCVCVCLLADNNSF